MKLSPDNSSAQDQYNELMCKLEKAYGKEEIERMCEYAQVYPSSECVEFELTTSYRTSYGD